MILQNFENHRFCRSLWATASAVIRMLNSLSRALGTKPQTNSKVDSVFYSSPLWFKLVLGTHRDVVVKTINCLLVVVLQTFRSNHQRCSVKKGVLRNSIKFTGKHLCQSLFFNKVAGPRPITQYHILLK